MNEAVSRFSIPGDRQTAGLRVLNEIQREARAAERLAELCYIAVNRTGALVSYRQAAIYERRGGKVRVTALSGVADFDPRAEFTRTLDRLLARLSKAGKLERSGTLRPADCGPEVAEEWSKDLPAEALVVPFRRDGPGFAGLILFREEPWTDGELQICDWLADAYSHAWIALKPKTVVRMRRRHVVRRLLLAACVVGLVAAAFLPVRLSAVASSRIVARSPIVVTAPYDGLIKSVDVEPFNTVKRGDVLFRLDDTVIRSRYEIALRALEVARAEHRRVSRRAFSDSDSKAQISILEKRVELRRTEADYQKSLLDRTVVHAASAGVAVFADRNDWIGKPVRVGEKIMQIAEPTDSILEIDLPVGDAIALDVGARVVLFLDTDPLHPQEARISRTSYEPVVAENQVAVYRLRARLAKDATSARLGAHGTAKIYGQEVTLFFYLFRRPIAEIRRMTGL